MLVACQKNHAEFKEMSLMRNFRVVPAVAAIAAIASLSACFPSPGDIFGGGGNGSPASVSGKWSFMLSSNHGSSNNVDLEANFSQSAKAISAAQSVILSSSPCDFGTNFIQGTVSGNNISFTLAFGTGHPTASFSGSVSNNGLSMSGNYKIPPTTSRQIFHSPTAAARCLTSRAQPSAAFLIWRVRIKRSVSFHRRPTQRMRVLPLVTKSLAQAAASRTTGAVRFRRWYRPWSAGLTPAQRSARIR
jgi:hypothetical protein